MRLGLEAAGFAPDVQENLAHQILGERSVVDHTQDEPKDPYIVPHVEHVHGALVASSNRSDQGCIRSFLSGLCQLRSGALPGEHEPLCRVGDCEHDYPLQSWLMRYG